mmetsp:Transcript_64756/g.124931  ORF Transcript_64756/g.124931 Transcript_64756/m.124931 type:complete len:217 (-) Transcript_64756:77-727(-)
MELCMALDQGDTSASSMTFKPRCRRTSMAWALATTAGWLPVCCSIATSIASAIMLSRRTASSSKFSACSCRILASPRPCSIFVEPPTVAARLQVGGALTVFLPDPVIGEGQILSVSGADEGPCTIVPSCCSTTHVTAMPPRLQFCAPSDSFGTNGGFVGKPGPSFRRMPSCGFAADSTMQIFWEVLSANLCLGTGDFAILEYLPAALLVKDPFVRA